MKKNREAAVEKINQLFGLDVSVEFTSSWDYRLKNGRNLTEQDFKDPDLFDTGSSEQAEEPEQAEELEVNKETENEDDK